MRLRITMAEDTASRRTRVARKVYKYSVASVVESDDEVCVDVAALAVEVDGGVDEEDMVGVNKSK